MEEIKFRISAINMGTSGATRMPPAIVREHCYLQIRMICELIALGCLTAHGDIDATTKRLRKEWAADRIIEEMGRLHPDFFPLPVNQKTTGRFHHLTPKPNPFSSSDLVKIYHECGAVLHRGSIKKLLAQTAPMHVNYPEIAKKAQLLADLLATHIVVLKDANAFITCVLSPANQPKVSVAIAERSALSPPVE